jgi:hypothetical protein
MSVPRTTRARTAAVSLLALAATAAATLVAPLSPARAATTVADCRSVALARDLSYAVDLSSTRTGPMTLSATVHGSAAFEVCYSLMVATGTAVSLGLEADATLTGTVDGILSGTDGAVACATVRVAVAGQAEGTVTASIRDTVLASSPLLPPVTWNHSLTKETTVPAGEGEDIRARVCVDSSGSVSAS